MIVTGNDVKQMEPLRDTTYYKKEKNRKEEKK